MIPSISANSEETITISLDVSRGSKLTVVVDYNNNLVEYSESNNRAENIYKALDLMINISTQFDSTIINFLKREFERYNIVSSNPDLILNIGYNFGDTTRGCSKGVVYNEDERLSYVHTGLIFTEGITKTVFGAKIEGIVNAVIRLNKEDITKH